MIGPAAPDHLRRTDAENGDDPNAPAVEPETSPTRGTIGPTLPPHLSKRKVVEENGPEEETAQASKQEECSDDEIGPSLKSRRVEKVSF